MKRVKGPLAKIRQSAEFFRQHQHTIHRHKLKPIALLQAHQEQNGHCLLCGKITTSLTVDHCHTTGAFRALLCQLCNSIVGIVESHPGRIKGAHAYVAWWRMQWPEIQNWKVSESNILDDDQRPLSRWHALCKWIRS